MKMQVGGRVRLRTDFAFKVLAWRVARHSSDQSDQRPAVPFPTCRNRYRRSCPSAAARRRMRLGLMNRPAAIADISEFTSAQVERSDRCLKLIAASGLRLGLPQGGWDARERQVPCCYGFSDACRGWTVPRARAAGVREASGEETAGRPGYGGAARWAYGDLSAAGRRLWCGRHGGRARSAA